MATGKDAVIEAAIRLEQEGQKFYRDAAAAAENEPARKFFLSFAEDEVKHERYLRDWAGHDVSAEDDGRQLHSHLRSIFADVPGDQRAAIAASDSDSRAIDAAIDREKKAVQAYRKWAGEADDDATRDCCLVLVKIELFHQKILEEAVQFLDGTATWFMEQEGWSFDGA